MAGTTLGNEIAKRNLLKYSRTQEAAADQAGMGFLDATQQSSRGMLEFFREAGGPGIPVRPEPGSLSADPSADHGPHRVGAGSMSSKLAL